MGGPRETLTRLATPGGPEGSPVYRTRTNGGNVIANVEKLVGRDPRIHLVLFGFGCTLMDAVVQPFGLGTVFTTFFANNALLTLIFFGIRWAMMLFCALAVGYTSILLLTRIFMAPWERFGDLTVPPVERLMPDVGALTVTAIYAVFTVILVILTQRALVSTGATGRKK